VADRAGRHVAAVRQTCQFERALGAGVGVGKGGGASQPARGTRRA